MEECIINNINDDSRLYKVLKVRMKDFETHEEVDRKQNGEVKKDKDGKDKMKIVTTNVIKIITKDVEYDKNNEKKIFQATSINHKDIKQFYTLIKEPETIRIIKAIAQENNCSSLEKDDYIFIKDLITVDVKVKTYEKETKGEIVLFYQEFDKDGNIKKDDNGKLLETRITYKRLLASTGGVRSKKVTFIRKELFDKANDILLCGLPKDMEYPQISKFNGYYALANTDSTPVLMPRMIVINDYEKPITETFDVVRPKKDEKGNRIENEYTCKAEENYTVMIKPFDGAGIVDISMAKLWAKELGLYDEKVVIGEDSKEKIETIGYIPSYYQFRAIPGIKGNLYVMNLLRYAIDYNIKTGKKAVIRDAFGNDVEILGKNDELLIDVILTKSQFKFYSKYKELWEKDGFKQWEKFFNTPIHRYTRTFNIAKYGVNKKDIKDEVILSYQPLQTLHFGNNQIKKICEPTIEKIKLISSDRNAFLKFRGLVDDFETEQNKKESVLVPQYYKALKENEALWNDKFIQSKVAEDIKGFKERSYKAAIIADGNYQVLMPDIIGLIQYAFNEDVVGCLKANEVYSRYWIDKKKDKIDLIRFPHIAQEHRVVNVVQPEFEKNKNWLKYITEGIVTSMYDSNVLAANSADFDGDKICSVSTEEIVNQVEMEKANTIVFDDEDDKTEKKENEANTKAPRINDTNVLIRTDVMGMGNNIGNVINQISKLWSIVPKNDKEKDIIQEYIRVMSVIGSLTIDFVKTGIKVPIPPSILKFLKDNDVKKPDFMKWKYKNIAKEERAINRNKRLTNEEEIDVFGKTECTVNRISWYMQDMVKDIELQTDSDAAFDYCELYNEFNIRAEGFEETQNTMLELKEDEDKIGYLQNKDSDDFVDSDDNTEQYKIFYKYARNKLIGIIENKNYKLTKEKMTDYLIYIVTHNEAFTKYNNMNLIWNIWGNELTRRLNKKKLVTRQINKDKLENSTGKLKKKLDKMKKAKEKVYIQIFKPDAKDEDKEIVKIYDEEIESIKNIKDEKNQKLALTLLTLEKFCEAYGKDFNIANNKKSIKMYNIYQLAGINHKNIEGHLKQLKDKNIIEFEEKDKGKVLQCRVKIHGCGNEIAELKDINEVKKLFELVS